MTLGRFGLSLLGVRITDVIPILTYTAVFRIRYLPNKIYDVHPIPFNLQHFKNLPRHLTFFFIYVYIQILTLLMSEKGRPGPLPVPCPDNRSGVPGGVPGGGCGVTPMDFYKSAGRFPGATSLEMLPHVTAMSRHIPAVHGA